MGIYKSSHKGTFIDWCISQINTIIANISAITRGYATKEELNTEVTRATTVEGSLRSDIQRRALASSLSTETTRAKKAEQDLQTLVNTKASTEALNQKADDLIDIIDRKASQTDLTALANRVSAIEDSMRNVTSFFNTVSVALCAQEFTVYESVEDFNARELDYDKYNELFRRGGFIAWEWSDAGARREPDSVGIFFYEEELDSAVARYSEFQQIIL